MTHYEVGKYLSNLLQQLTINEFTSEDSFDTASKIRDIPKELFTNGYVFVSFDVTFQRKTMKKNVLVRSGSLWNVPMIFMFSYVNKAASLDRS